MKLNNHGWSLSQMLFLCSVLLMALFVAVFFIMQMTRQFGVEFKESITNKEDGYYTVEDNVEAATLRYVHEYNLDGTGITLIKTNELLNLHYLKEEDLTTNGDYCKGYAEMDSDKEIHAYIKCKGYITEYYQSWKMGDA